MALRTQPIISQTAIKRLPLGSELAAVVRLARLRRKSGSNQWIR
jgi:hypothetical protein